MFQLKLFPLKYKMNTVDPDYFTKIATHADCLIVNVPCNIQLYSTRLHMRIKANTRNAC